MIAAIYVRVSTFEQEPENQLGDLRRYVAARGWACKEFVDRGVSGAKDRRPSLDLLVATRNGVVSMWSSSGGLIVSDAIFAIW
jgi:DNA invertase Pin-like site-specific DNA recombinase